MIHSLRHFVIHNLIRVHNISNLRENRSPSVSGIQRPVRMNKKMLFLSGFLVILNFDNSLTLLLAGQFKPA